jgi:hypothetical protein
MSLEESLIVEFGTGASTHYFAARSHRVISYEFDTEYLAVLARGKMQNTSIRGPLNFASKSGSLEIEKKYESFLALDLNFGELSLETAEKIDWQHLIEDIKFTIASSDIIFIDGAPRILAAKICSEFSLNSQLIILDNSDRDYERNASLILQKAGYFEIPFTGLGPLNPYSWTTSFFIRELSTLKNLIKNQ